MVTTQILRTQECFEGIKPEDVVEKNKMRLKDSINIDGVVIIPISPFLNSQAYCMCLLLPRRSFIDKLRECHEMAK